MDTYLLLKTLHIVGVVLFLGNIIVTGWWKVAADRTRHPRVVAFAQRQVTLTDWLFTAGGVGLVVLGGPINAMLHDMPLTTSWIAQSYALFVVSGVLWVGILIPVQIKLARMAHAFADAETIPDAYWYWERVWLWVGMLAIIVPLAAVPVMVFKP